MAACGSIPPAPERGRERKEHKEKEHKRKRQKKRSGKDSKRDQKKEKKSGKNKRKRHHHDRVDGKISAVSGKRIKMKVEKTKRDVELETNRQNLLAFLNDSYD